MAQKNKLLVSKNVLYVGMVVAVVLIGIAFINMHSMAGRKIITTEADSNPARPTSQATPVKLSATPLPKNKPSDVVGWKTYSNKEMRISFKYPTEWIIVDNTPVSWDEKYGSDQPLLIIIVKPRSNMEQNDADPSLELRITKQSYEDLISSEKGFYGDNFEVGRKGIIISEIEGYYREYPRAIYEGEKKYLINRYIYLPYNNGENLLSITLTPEQKSIGPEYSVSAKKNMLILEKILQSLEIK